MTASDALRTSPIHERHVALDAKMADFGGWDMPLHYGSQVEEHHQVRRDCGVFDVSHMTVRRDIQQLEREGQVMSVASGMS